MASLLTFVESCAGYAIHVFLGVSSRVRVELGLELGPGITLAYYSNPITGHNSSPSSTLIISRRGTPQTRY